MTWSQVRRHVGRMMCATREILFIQRIHVFIILVALFQRVLGFFSSFFCGACACVYVCGDGLRSSYSFPERRHFSSHHRHFCVSYDDAHDDAHDDGDDGGLFPYRHPPLHDLL